MKIVALTVVRNELDILEVFVRYHLEAVDHMVIADHRSVDGSSELLRKLEAEGLPLTIRPLESPLVRRRQTATELLWETAETMRPDLVLMLDADEFVASDGPAPVRAALESLTDTAPIAIPRRTYVPTPDDDQSDPNPLTRIVHRRASEPRRKYKVAVPGRFARDREYGLSNGNHRLVLWGSRAEVAAVNAPGLFLAHYPVRTVEQLSARFVGLWAGQVARSDRPPSMDTRKIVAGLARKGDPGPEWLRDVALSYGTPYEADSAASLVRDPLEPVPAQRYPADPGVITLGILADTIEEVAEVMKAERGASAERTVATVVERMHALEDRLARLEGDAPPAASPGGEQPADAPAQAPDRRAKRVRRDTLARAQRRVRALEGELEELRESKSWKLTAPIRSLGSLGRSSGKR